MADNSWSDPAQLLFRFSAAVDQRRAQDAAACFTRDGLFRPGDKAIVGVENIGQFYGERLADPRRMTRHVWANVSVSEIDADTVHVTALLTNYAFEPLVSETALQMRIGNVECRLVRDTQGDWLFAEQSYQRAFSTSLPLDAAPLR